MILTNYRIWQSITMVNTLKHGNQSPNPNTIDLTGMKALSDPTGSYSMPISTYYNQQGTFENWSLNQQLTSRIGSGTTEPTESDYALSSDQTVYFSNIVRSFNAMADGNSFKLVHTISGTNSTNNTRTITEIGIAKNIYVSGYPSGAYKEFLFTRSLLDKPIEVQPGRGFTLTFQWTEA